MDKQQIVLTKVLVPTFQLFNGNTLNEVKEELDGFRFDAFADMTEVEYDSVVRAVFHVDGLVIEYVIYRLETDDEYNRRMLLKEKMSGLKDAHSARLKEMEYQEYLRLKAIYEP